MEITEELMYYLWNTRRFDHKALTTFDGEALEILQYGNRNGSSGPDFINGAIRLAGLQWHRNIEMHVCTSDWKKHRHHTDGAYENVILHVVWQHDTDPTEGKVPILVLSPRVEHGLIQQYNKLRLATSWLPCESLLNPEKLQIMALWRDVLAVDRLQRKVTGQLENLVKESSTDWDALVYRLMVSYLAGKENRVCGELLSQRLTLSILDRNAPNPLDILALFLGTAACLDEVKNEDVKQKLDQSFRHMHSKYGISPIQKASWRKFGMRASGMPVRRLAQIAAVFAGKTRYFHELIACRDVESMKKILPDKLPEETGWRELLPSKSLLSKPQKDMLLINVLLPVWFYYHHQVHGHASSLSIFDMMHQLPPEDNAICRRYKKLGFPVQSALDSQALLELRGQYCEPKRCIACRIGQQFFSGQ